LRSIAAGALVLMLASSAAAAPAAPGRAAVMRAIAIAEDQRRGTGGELRGDLAHADPVVRARTALAVGRLQDTTLAGALVPLLEDGSVAVRREAVFAIGQIGWKPSAPSLKPRLADRDAGVAGLAIEALGKLGDRSTTAWLLPFLSDPRAPLRAHAAVAMWRLADTSAVDALLARRSERDPTVRWRVVYALEKLPAPARVVPALTTMLHDPDPLVRAHVVRTLGRQKSRAATPALLSALADADVPVRVNALRALVQVADSARAGQLAAIVPALAHRDPYLRVTAATALAEAFAWQAATAADSAAARAALERGLADGDAATRGACGRALVARFAGEGLERAHTLLEDPSPFARVALLDGLRALPAARWREDAAPSRRGPDLPGRAGALLLAGLAPEQPRLERMTSAEIAGGLRATLGPAAFAPLLTALRAGVRDADVLVAASCAGALGDAGDSASVALLAGEYAARGKDADADARQAIRDALRQLAGRAFADSLELANRPSARSAEYSQDFAEAPPETSAVLHTQAGVIVWRFLGREAPQTVRNFVRLARRGYFDGLVVHRVVPDFVIQDGDPTGTGSGGPGWTIRCEYNQQRYESGQVGMALSGKDTGGSQWFITLAPQPHLDGKYTIFAHVTRGLEVARRITQGTRIDKVDILP
jgi:cyclophilin family peptidyl-prolyl cis-trans isomerase/HEAT repeat protein